MIVFDLKCPHDHVFEAWFGSSSDYEAQRARGLVSCPLCGDGNVIKAPMAANVPAKSNSRAGAIPEKSEPVPVTNAPEPAQIKAMLAKLATMQADALKQSTWVGRDFDSAARAMDAGEAEKAPIHGEVSPEEAKALMEDGINVMPLPFPVVPPEKRN